MREHEQRTWLAWHIAALMRTKKLPPLTELLTVKRGPRETSPEAQWRVMSSIAALTAKK